MLDESTANVINRLLTELGSELDLHYENEDFFALSPTINVMKEAAELVTSGGFNPPSIYFHILKRYNQHRN